MRTKLNRSGKNHIAVHSGMLFKLHGQSMFKPGIRKAPRWGDRLEHLTRNKMRPVRAVDHGNGSPSLSRTTDPEPD